MLDQQPAHPTFTFALDVVDKAAKLLAVFLGGIWTYWNYRKSRTYAQRMELVLSGSIYRRDHIFVEVLASLKNLGAAQHVVQQEGTSCEITAVFEDLSEKSLHVFDIFVREQFIEPGEAVSDVLLFRLALAAPAPIWLRVDLRVASASVEWRQSNLIRVNKEVEPLLSSPKEGSPR